MKRITSHWFWCLLSPDHHWSQGSPGGIYKFSSVSPLPQVGGDQVLGGGKREVSLHATIIANSGVPFRFLPSPISISCPDSSSL